MTLRCVARALAVTAAVATASPIASSSSSSPAGADDPKWAAVTQVLADGATNKVFPGVVALVGDKTGTLYSATFGNYTDDGRLPPFAPTAGANPTPSVTGTRFDMASCTKVLATTSAVAWLYERGFVGLDDTVAQYLGPAYATQGKGPITLRNCLLHNAGYPPDPDPCYWEPDFGCKGACGGW
jgi:CubicO group peptidase (beta-lactamase class C family)